ncbi:MAG TPA: C39 family peptidase [Patescibacteria group bacterium]|nr:C39 family peptidase [Patescibacteria group bacterium]
MVKKLILLFFSLAFLFTPKATTIFAQTADCQDISDLNKRVICLQAKINDLQGQKRTLSSQIAVMDNQINLAQARIDSTKRDISDLTLDIDTADKKINGLAKSLDNLIKVLLNRMVTTYEIGQTQPFELLLSSTNATNFFSRLNYLRIAQSHDKQLIYLTQQAKNDYANQKNIFEDKKKRVVALKTQLENYSKQLEQNKKAKQQLLAETQGSEATYQQLLAQAEAQLAAFSNFAAVRGGASILTDQTVCDDWGCYYNQRDSQWGNLALNHTQFTIASDGCLVTSMAMIYTHYGHRGVNPMSINSNSDNFASYYPAYLKYTITADGATSSRVGSIVDSELANGNPVVVGVSYDGGPISDHFVVLVSGSSGNYIMNDPFTPNGHKIPFSSHYSVGGIREIDKVAF